MKPIIPCLVAVLTTAQHSYFQQHGVFTTRLADLQWSDASGLITIELTVTSAGNAWSATGRHRFLMDGTSALSVSGQRAGPGPE